MKLLYAFGIIYKNMGRGDMKMENVLSTANIILTVIAVMLIGGGLVVVVRGFIRHRRHPEEKVRDARWIVTESGRILEKTDEGEKRREAYEGSSYEESLRSLLKSGLITKKQYDEMLRKK